MHILVSVILYLYYFLLLPLNKNICFALDFLSIFYQLKIRIYYSILSEYTDIINWSIMPKFCC